MTGVYAGFIDTEMTAHLTVQKSSPQDVVNKALDGYATGIEHVLGDERSKQVLAVGRRGWHVPVRQMPRAWTLRLARRQRWQNPPKPAQLAMLLEGLKWKHPQRAHPSGLNV